MKRRKNKNLNKNYNIKPSFWRYDNRIYLYLIIACVIIHASIELHLQFFECEALEVITNFIISAILPAALIPLGLHLGQLLHEKSQMKNICISIIDLSMVLMGNINEHLLKSNKPMIDNFDELKNKDYTQEIDFNGFETLPDLFVMLPNKLSRITQMDFIKTNDAFEYAITKTSASTNAAFSNNNFSTLYMGLGNVIQIMNGIKPPFRSEQYIQIFDKRIKKLNEELKTNLYNYTEEYIINNLENNK